MRESRFVQENKEAWEAFEGELRRPSKSPKRIERLYIQITDNLSYARTFYGHRSVRHYLNGLAQWMFLDIYKNKRAERNAFVVFWTEELPSIMYHSRRPMLVAFLFFVFSVAIGVFSAIEHPEFVREILGDGYVEMTLENIDKGDPMAVYKQANEMDMFLGITLNNLIVAFRTFILGLFLGIGTLASLLQNGIMLGSFQYFFIDKGLFVESFLTIWQHGTLEISTIVMAGGAGLVMGKGLILPGTYSRVQSLKNSGRRAIKIMMGIAPVIIMAGLLEGFVTRYTDMPDLIRLLVIIVSLIFIVGYYVIYPRRIPKSIRDNYKFEGLNDIPEKFEFDRYKIRSSGEIFTDSFGVLRQIGAKFLWIIIGSSFVYAVLVQVISLKLEASSGYLNSISFYGMLHYFDYTMFNWLWLLNTLLFGFSWWMILRKLADYVEGIKRPRLWTVVNLFALVGVANALLFIGGASGYFVFIANLPLTMLAGAVMVADSTGIFNGLGRSVAFLGADFSRMAGASLSLLLITMFMYFLLTSPLLLMQLNVINWTLPFDAEWNEIGMRFIGVWSVIAGLLFSQLFLTIGFGTLYLTLVEIKTATGLKRKIEAVRQAKKTKGIERE